MSAAEVIGSLTYPKSHPLGADSKGGAFALEEDTDNLLRFPTELAEEGQIALERILNSDEQTPEDYRLWVEAGLFEAPPKVLDGLRANTVEVERVVGFGGRQGIQTAGLIKLKTQVDQTETGRQLEAALQDRGVCLKDRNNIRVFREKTRKLSFDELGNLAVNVYGIGRHLYEKPLKLNVFGAGRPPAAEELEYKGINANDSFRKALKLKADQRHIEVDDMYERAGYLYSGHAYWIGESDGTYTNNAGLATWATHKGSRQLVTTADHVDWLTGLEYFGYVQTLSPAEQRMHKTLILAKTAVHVALQTNAA